MKEIFYNDDNLLESNIDEIVVRVKAVIINKNNDILMGYCDGTYQFPGGHLEKDETLVEGLRREISEETGILLDEKEELSPFMLIRYYTKNYRNKGINRENKIYYYLIRSEVEPVISNMSLDAYEKEHNYILKRVNLNEIESELERTVNDNSINKILYKEIGLVIENI